MCERVGVCCFLFVWRVGWQFSSRMRVSVFERGGRRRRGKDKMGEKEKEGRRRRVEEEGQGGGARGRGIYMKFAHLAHSHIYMNFAHLANLQNLPCTFT